MTLFFFAGAVLINCVIWCIAIIAGAVLGILRWRRMRRRRRALPWTLTPPMHYNCRYIVRPARVPLEAGQMVTAEQIELEEDH